MNATAYRVSVLLLATLGSLATAPCAAQASDPAADRFQALDVNHDGGLSKYEFDSDVVLGALDSNHDDLVSADELQVFLGPKDAGAEDAAYRISVVDQDNDGQLSYNELQRGTEKRFEWMDANKDGNVDLAELQANFGKPMIR